MNPFGFGMNTGKSLSTKSGRQQNSLAMAHVRLAEDAKAEHDIFSEELAERRSNAISNMASQMGTSRSGVRKRILAEKMQFRDAVRDKLFLESIYDIFVESLILDEDFKERYAGTLFKLTEDTVKGLFAEDKLSYKDIANEGSQVMRSILTLCEETATDAAEEKFDTGAADKKGAEKKILNEKNKKPELNKEAKGDFDDKKAIETKTIAETVKDKVVQVIRDEQSAAEAHEEMMNEIENETTPTEPETGIPDQGTEMDPEAADDQDAEVVTESKMLAIRIPNRVAQHSLFKSIQMNVTKKAMNEAKAMVSESEDDTPAEVNMDLVLAETIAYYTLLECMYTTRLLNVKASEMRSFAKTLVFKN